MEGSNWKRVFGEAELQTFYITLSLHFLLSKVRQHMPEMDDFSLLYH
jgi:hypothetical protein